MLKQYANLHFHSTHSDGAYTPEKLVEVAAEEGYRGLCLTDHDTFTGNAPLRAAAQKYGIETLYGTEFSTAPDKNGWAYHITGIEYDPTYPAMADYLRKLAFNETNQTRILCERGLKSGRLHGFTWKDVEDDNPGVAWFCNEHVFRLMKKKGLATDTDYHNFFLDVYGDHRAEVPPKYPFLTPPEVIDLIHAAGGIAIVAHLIYDGTPLRSLPSLLSYGIDGVEVWHTDMTPRYQLMAMEFALEHHLYISGGTDHSGRMSGQYERYPDDPNHNGYYFPELAGGTQKLFFEEICDRKLAPDAERRAIYEAFRRDLEENHTDLDKVNRPDFSKRM